MKHRHIIGVNHLWIGIVVGVVIIAQYSAMAFSACAAPRRRLAPVSSYFLATQQGRLLPRIVCLDDFIGKGGGHRRDMSTSSQEETTNEGDTSSQNSNYYERIASPKYVMAPMVAQSDLAFRMLCRSTLASNNNNSDNNNNNNLLCYTQMIHATNFVRDKTFQTNHLDVFDTSTSDWYSNLPPLLESQKAALVGLEDYRTELLLHKANNQHDMTHRTIRDSPLVVQIAGHDPDTMLEAAQIILDRSPPHAVQGIDVNLGCPQTIARKGRYGAHLLEQDLDQACRVIHKLRTHLPQHAVGVSAKIRLPLDEGDLEHRIASLVHAGADLLTVHGRTLVENKTAVRHCNLDQIARAVQIARHTSGNPTYPVVANGGIEFATDIPHIFETTGASAVMSSEALLEHPGIFAQAAAESVSSHNNINQPPEELMERQFRYAREYMEWAILVPPVPGSLGRRGGSFNVVRGHLFKFLHRYLMENPDLRDAMGDQKTCTIAIAQTIVQQLYERYHTSQTSSSTTNNAIHWDALISSQPESSWYRRHRGANTQFVHRRKTKDQLPGDASTQLTIEERKERARQRIQKLRDTQQGGRLPELAVKGAV